MKSKTFFILTVLALLVGGCAPLATPPVQATTEPAKNGYSVNITPADFVAVVDNPYFPRIPGDKFVYEGQTANGFERIELVILKETKVIMGVTTTIMRDTVYLDGQIREDTYDWFAQDKDGNVWYFGEDVNDYENGVVVSKAGSWEAGVDGAQPGIVMYGDPSAHVGETYLQEYYAGQAEDTADLLSVRENLEIAFGSFENVVQTYDYTPLDPNSQEQKFYVAGLGKIRNVNLITGDVIDLIAYIPAGGAPALTDTYSVSLTAADFVARIDNPYMPFVPGSKWVYEATLEDGTVERNEIEVLQETRDVNGVAATIVHDTVYVGGQLVEETYDWYAQDKDGNVWYLGEEVDNYKDGVLVDHAGSWEWGKDGALPGIIMWADPSAHMNEEYYQEYYAGEAEDKGQVLGVSESVTVPFGAFENVVKTYDFSTIDPDLQEHKFYAAGVGFIKEINVKTGEEVMLIEFTSP